MRAVDERGRECAAGLRRDPIPAGVVEALQRPATYPDDPSAGAGIEEVQTHLSFVFLTRDRVYKLRKPVDLGFVDFSSRRERIDDCVREVQLNRRLAPDVYLGLAPLISDGRRVRLGPLAASPLPDGPDGEALEHCVVMRRLPPGRDALSLLTRAELGAEALDRVAETLAAFHRRVRLESAKGIDPERWFAGIADPALANYAALAASRQRGIDAALVRALEDRTRDELLRLREPLLRRLAESRAVDGHGDLHLRHVWFEREASPPLIIDCLEFSSDLRRIDAASEVAFLAMDLTYRERADLAERFLRAYARDADDFGLYSVVDFFESYRAAVRAKVAAVTAGEPEVGCAQRRAARSSAQAHLAVAAEALSGGARGDLILVCGMVGTGKTTFASALADRLSSVVIASDRVRKHMAGLGPLERPSGARAEALYSSAMTQRVYAGLLQRALPVLDSGRSGILDATFAVRALRAAVRRWASERGVRALLVETQCDPETVRARLLQRQSDGDDPSDAGVEHYREFAPRFEPAEEWPVALRFTIDMGRDDWRERALEIASRIETPHRRG
jgi:aminoglycoside phosphotransferase family enzyme/predicted kinase